MLLQIELCVVSALSDALVSDGEPAAGLVDQIQLHRKVHQLSPLGDALAVHDIENRLFKGRRNLVFHNLGARAVADDLGAVLNRLGPADIDTHGSVELERVAARCRLGVSVHDADLHTKLVDENNNAVRLRDVAGKLAKRLRHEPRLQTDKGVSHLAFNFRARRQRRDRVDDHHIHCARAHERVRNFQRLLAGIRLRDQHGVDVHADSCRIVGVQRVLGIYERDLSAALLRLRHNVQCQRRLTGRLRPVDLNDSALRHAADAERRVQCQRARRNRFHVHLRPVAQAHDRALAEVLFNLGDCRLQCLFLIAQRSLGFLLFYRHSQQPSFSVFLQYSTGRAINQTFV